MSDTPTGRWAKSARWPKFDTYRVADAAKPIKLVLNRYGGHGFGEGRVTIGVGLVVGSRCIGVRWARPNWIKSGEVA